MDYKKPSLDQHGYYTWWSRFVMAGDVRETESGPTLDGHEHATGQQKQCYAHTCECVDYGSRQTRCVYSPQSSFEKRETEPKHTHRENNGLVKKNEGKRRALMDLWSDAVPVATAKQSDVKTRWNEIYGSKHTTRHEPSYKSYICMNRRWMYDGN